MVVKFREVGNSIGITIPKEFVRQLRIRRGEEANIEVQSGNMVVKPIKPNITIKSLFADYNGDYKPAEFDWGEPKGKEVW